MAAAFEEAELRRRNEELERAVMESQHREVVLGWELERMRERLRVAEVAEERLCGEIGELEAEAVVQAREYRRRIEALSHSLGSALDLLASAGLHLSPDS